MTGKLFCSLVSAHLLILHICWGQEPVNWSTSALRIGEGEYKIDVVASIAPGWHIYSQYLSESDAPATKITFGAAAPVKFGRKIKETGDHLVIQNEWLDVGLDAYMNSVTFSQHIFVMNPAIQSMQVSIEYMSCSTELCIPAKRDLVIYFN